MVRRQIQLTEKQAKELKVLAARKARSRAELIRREADRLIEAESEEMRERWRRAVSVVGKGHSGLSDIAENHDKYLNQGVRW